MTKHTPGRSATDFADMFWAAGDGERSYFSIDEAVDEALDNDARPGDTIRLDCAKRLPEITVRILEGGDYEIVDQHSCASDHIASRDCWCKPQQDSEGPSVWVHNDVKENNDGR